MTLVPLTSPAEVAPSSAPSPVAAASANVPPVPSPRFWILDDSPLESEMARRALGDRVEVESFVDAATMLERISSGPLPVVLLLDAKLAGISGAEVCKHIRETYDESQLPILMLTVDGQKSSVVAALRAGANDYVTKPFDGPELKARVEALARMRELFARVQTAERGHAFAARALRVERERLGSLFEHTPSGVCVFSGPDHRIDYVNPAFLRLAGHPVPLGIPARDCEPALASLFGPLDRVFSAGEEHSAQAAPLEVGAGDEGRFVKVTYLPRRDVNGVVAGIDLFAFDVSDQVLRRRKLEDLLSVASHELRTPLAAMQLHLQVLRAKTAASGEGLPLAVMSRHLGAIERQITRQVRLIEDLIDVSRLGADRLRLDPEETDLAAFTADAVKRFLDDSGDAPSLQLEVPDALPVEIDRFRYEQIVTNLLSNATKYGAGKPVLARVEAAGALRVRISVRDQGIGISAADLERIFDRFERSVAVKHHAGLGLGLWITRRLIEAMGGTITVQSELGRGSEFMVELPRRALR